MVNYVSLQIIRSFYRVSAQLASQQVKCYEENKQIALAIANYIAFTSLVKSSYVQQRHQLGRIRSCL